MIFFWALTPDGWAIPGVHGNWEDDEIDGNVQGGVFLIRSHNEGLLFDTGNRAPGTENGMGTFIADKLDSENIDLKYIVLSHFHYDHTGNAEFLRNRYKAEIVAHSLERYLIEDPLRIIAHENFERFGVSAETALADYNLKPGESLGLSDPSIISRFWNFPVPVDREVADGDVLEVGDLKLTVLHLPGHTPGHIGLWNPNSASLYSGDLMHFPTPLHPYPMGDANAHIGSIRRCLELEAKYLWEGHLLGMYDRGAVTRRLKHLLQMQNDTEDRLLAVLARSGEPQTIQTLRPEVFPIKTDLNYKVTSGTGQRWAYAEACIDSHLRRLIELNKVERVHDDHIVKFALMPEGHRG